MTAAMSKGSFHVSIPVEKIPAATKASQVPQVLHTHGGAARFHIFISKAPPKLQLRSIQIRKVKGSFRKKLSNEKNLGWLGYIGDEISYPVI